MNRLNEIWKALWDLIHKWNFWLGASFVILNVFITKHILQSAGVHLFGIVVFVEILFTFLVIFLIKYASKKQWTIEKRYLMLAIIFGIAFLIFLPPGEKPDEANHFRRAYGIASGVLLPEVINDQGYGGSELPDGILDDLVLLPAHGTYSTLGERLTRGLPEEKTVQEYPNTAIYNFIVYVPQTLAALIGKTLNLSILATAYLMEIFNYAIFVLLIYFAIKLSPKFKNIILFVALNPMTLQEATSVSIDGLAIGLCLFLVAYVCWLIYGTKKVMDKKTLAVLYLMAIVIGLCKMVYLPLLLLYFLVPYERFGSKKKKRIHASIMIMICLLVNIGWLMATSGILTDFNTTPGVDVDSHLQTVVILKNPLGYLMKIAVTTNAYIFDWLGGLMGTALGSFNMHLPTIYLVISIVFFVILFSQRDEMYNLKKRDKIVIWAAFVIAVLLIYTSEYLQWTGVGAPIIDGIQGRYFLPILTLIPLMICRRNNKAPHMKLVTENGVLYFGLFINTIALVVFFANNI